MDNTSPTELAKLLRLSTDGTPGVFLPQEFNEMWRGPEALQATLNKRDLFEQRRAYSEELNALFLPSLVESYLQMEYNGRANIYTTVIQTAEGCHSASWRRFVRLFPAEATRILPKFAAGLVTLDAHWDLFMKQPKGPLSLTKTVVSFLSIFASLLVDRPPKSPLPSLPSSSRRTLRVLASRYEQQPELRAILKKKCEFDDELALQFLILLSLGVDLEPYMDIFQRMDHPVTWKNCELQSLKSVDSVCVSLEKGQEMMACSRCLAVRYCCKEHQKADWKRHKKFCFTPNW